MAYTPLSWYWLVGNKSDLVFSSAGPGYVALTDAGYEAWLAAGNLPSRIATDGELADVLAKAGATAAAIQAAGWTGWGEVSIADQYAVLKAAGCRISSTATPSLDAAYAIDDASIGKITAIAAGIGNGKGLPGGGSTFNLYDASGAAHAIGNADFLNLAAALETYVYDLIQAQASMLGGHGGTWPTQPVTIP
ncbi:MAG TPA: hypothetical protein VFA12_20055 [Stellaceae bacterium]|nr:hypothetical protein [Stellaceae bacterium]